MELNADNITLAIFTLVTLKIDSVDVLCPDIATLLLLVYTVFVINRLLEKYAYMWNMISFTHNQCYLMSVI